MASGDPLFRIGAWDFNPSGTNGALFQTRQSATTEKEVFHIAAFDDTTDQYLDIQLTMPDAYAGTTGITCSIRWAATVTTSTTIWKIGLRRLADDATGSDLDASHTYAFNSVTASPASASGEVAYDSITFTDGADMDNVVAGDEFNLRIYRDAVTDGMSGDAQLLSIYIYET